jgi:hypothetical protein
MSAAEADFDTRNALFLALPLSLNLASVVNGALFISWLSFLPSAKFS